MATLSASICVICGSPGVGGWLCDFFVPSCLCGCDVSHQNSLCHLRVLCDSVVFLSLRSTPSVPIDHEVMQRTVEDGAQAIVEYFLDLAQAVPPRRMQNHQVTAAQFVDRLQQGRRGDDE